MPSLVLFHKGAIAILREVAKLAHIPAGTVIADPDGGEREHNIFHIIISLNDNAYWTREQIANYIEAQGY